MMFARFFFCLILLSACQQNTVPEGILPLDQMAPLVQEITLLETHFQTKFGVPSQYKKALDLSVARVLKKSSCSKADFEKKLEILCGASCLAKRAQRKTSY